MTQTFTVVLMAFAAAAPVGQARVPDSLDLSVVRALPTQHDGRWPPFDTVARDLIVSVTGQPFHDGHDPVATLLAWTFEPQSWRKQPLIEIGNAELRSELQLSASRDVFSFDELINHQPLRGLITDLGNIESGRKMNPLERKVSDLSEKLGTIQEIFAGQALRLIPDPDDVGGRWGPIGVSRPGGPADIESARSAWSNLRQAFVAGDAGVFATRSRELAAALAALPAAHRPTAEMIDTELWYNRLRPWRLGWIVMAIGAGGAIASMFVRRKWFDRLSALPLVAGFGILTYGLSLRWQIAGRIPAANMFESLLFLSWGMGLFAILAMLVFRNRVVPLTASVMAALSLFLADALPLDSFIRPIAPVLMDTVWMSIHVPVIMVSYSVLAIGVLIAHGQLVVMALAPKKRQLSTTLDELHYWYIHVGSILLAAGIITGSMWAASSWGRYWGWDPKEVWSLVALLGYLAILHGRLGVPRVPAWAYAAGAALILAMFVVVGSLQAAFSGTLLLAFVGVAAAMALFILAHGPFATAAKSIVCFWLIIMTYVGVNYVLGTGLHSYGFGTGAVVRYMFSLGGTDLAIVGVLGIIYVLRSRSARSGGVSLPVAPAR